MTDRSDEWTLWSRCPPDWEWERWAKDRRIRCEQGAKMVREELPHSETLVLPPGETPALEKASPG